MANFNTYSFKDTSGAFTHPVAGAFVFAGQIGMNSLMIEMGTEKTAHDVAGDGTVMVSAIAGDNGQISIEVQQTSDLHLFLLAWYNAIKIAMDAGDVTNWATAAITVRNLVDGSQHIIQGVSPQKIPNKPYQAHGQRMTWILLAADIQNITIGV